MASTGALGSFLGGLGGGAIGSAVVRLYLDSSQYSAGLAKVQGETEASAAKMSGAANIGGAALTTFLATYSLGAIKFLSSATAAAAEHQQVLAKLTAQIGPNTAAFEKQATALQNVTGYQDELVLSADTVLSRFKLSTAQVQAAIPTVLDYARATGQDVPAAAGNIGRALLGNTRALKAVGIQFTATGNTAKDFDTILGLLQGKIGGQAQAFGSTYAGQVEILKANFDDLKEAVGNQLLPVLQQIVPVLTDLTQKVGPLLADAIHAAVENLRPFIDALDKILSLLPDTSKAADSTGKSSLSLAGIWGGVLKLSADGLGKTMLGNNSILQSAVPILDNLSASSGDAAEQTDALTGASKEAGPAAKAMMGAEQAAADAIARVGDQATRATQKLKEQRNAMLSLAGGVLGLVADINTYRANQETVNKLQEHGKQGTQAYRDAVLQLLQSRAQLTQSLQDQAKAMDKNNRSTEDIRQRLFQLASQSGLSNKAVNNLVDNALSRLGARLDETSTKADKLNGALDRLNGKTVHATVDLGLTGSGAKWAGHVAPT